ncbi:MAG: hypothetical protein VKM98_11035 [Cyanobacteriota bacterium]|nr:hypothetical protein [Cyanobacteriota bacterium]
MSTALALLPLQRELERRPGPLLPQITAVLEAEGRPLRWAITAVNRDGPRTLLRLEAVVLVTQPG